MANDHTKTLSMSKTLYFSCTPKDSNNRFAKKKLTLFMNFKMGSSSTSHLGELLVAVRLATTKNIVIQVRCSQGRN